MSKLKTLNDDDLVAISENFSEFLTIEISKSISIKELEDMDLGISVSYDDEQLDVSVDVDLLFDSLTDINEEYLNIAVDNAYNRLDSFIDENYRE